MTNRGTNAEYDAAFEAGNAAFHAGKAKSQNPHQPSMTNASEATKERGWRHGWLWAETHAAFYGVE